MKRQRARDRSVRNFGQLTLQDWLPNEARSVIVVAPVNEGGTVRELIRETLMLRAGPADEPPAIVAEDPEWDSVLICSPS